jgi:hypothetical protein
VFASCAVVHCKGLKKVSQGAISKRLLTPSAGSRILRVSSSEAFLPVDLYTSCDYSAYIHFAPLVWPVWIATFSRTHAPDTSKSASSQSMCYRASTWTDLDESMPFKVPRQCITNHTHMHRHSRAQRADLLGFLIAGRKHRIH